VSGARESLRFADLPQLLRAGDCLVLNDTRVLQARIYGSKVPSGGRVEAVLLEETGPGVWHALLRPGRRLDPGQTVNVAGADYVTFTVVRRLDDGIAEIQFSTTDVLALLERCGVMPVPPYIRREADSGGEEDIRNDRQRYQTVYARVPGAVASPTAGLHFTPAVFDRLSAAGIGVAYVTLHVGLGTFRPVSTPELEAHTMHEERYELGTAGAEAINRARANGGRVIAVGTTAVRVLETCAASDGTVAPASGRTDLFLYPPHVPRATDGLVTNFHLPRSTLLMLVCTFAKREHVLNAYAAAAAEGFRFYSYGDCMLLL
jgi:S-adenosylmethionine:tRNA ribosyltransferase-isomerase